MTSNPALFTILLLCSVTGAARCPGPVETTFWDALLPPGPDRDALFKAVAQKEVPLERMGKPEDIAYLSSFLLSDLARWITGESIAIDGGYSAA